MQYTSLTYSTQDHKKMSSTFLPSSFNSTLTQENLLLSNTTSQSETANAYDHQGAALYIAVILIWYSSGLAMMLFLQVRPRTLQQQFLLDPSASRRKARGHSLTKNPFADYRNVQADNTTKQILNELKDPERRQRLWKIYYSGAQKQDEPDSQYYQTITTDGATINRINRRLADIHRMNSASHGNVLLPPDVPPRNGHRPSIVSNFESAKFFGKRFPTLRRPSTNTTTTTPRSSLIRVQSQTAATPSANVPAVAMEPVVKKKQFLEAPTHDSRERSSSLISRFTIEKVSDSEQVSE